MKKGTEISLWLVIALVLITPVIYVISSHPGREFWDSIVSGILSTAIALIAGIPIALWLDRSIKQREALKAKADARQKEKELLELIKEELDFTNSFHVHRKANTDSIQIQPLKSDLWRAVTAAGKLNLISNHKLLNRITSAYYVVDIVKNIEEEAYLASRTSAIKFSSGKSAAQVLIEDARQFDTLLTESIASALKDIDSELSKST